MFFLFAIMQCKCLHVCHTNVNENEVPIYTNGERKKKWYRHNIWNCTRIQYCLLSGSTNFLKMVIIHIYSSSFLPNPHALDFLFLDKSPQADLQIFWYGKSKIYFNLNRNKERERERRGEKKKIKKFTTVKK